MSGFLQKIAALTAARVAQAQKTAPVEQLRAMPLFSRAPQDPLPAFRQKGYNVIAEVKFASPSQGEIRPAPHDPAAIATGYLDAGARMLSILTEPEYFKGELSYLRAVREKHPQAFLLRKDFTVDPYQLFEARAYGADVILLIAAMTPPAVTKDLFRQAKDLGLAPLVEVHDEAELEEAIALGADFIGVNNRNLKTLKIDLDTSRRLAAQKPENAVFICESGLSTSAELDEMRALGFDGFLMGTSFMKQENPGAALARLMGSVKCA